MRILLKHLYSHWYPSLSFAHGDTKRQRKAMPMNAFLPSYGDNFIPVLQPGYPVIHEHTDRQPFCPDPTCPCKENTEAIAKVHRFYLDGLITAEHANAIIMG